MENKSDKELLTAIVDGNKDAFNELYRRHEKLIRNNIKRYVTETFRSETDDICQHFWLNFIQYIESYDQSKHALAWLVSCAIRAIYNYRQKTTLPLRLDSEDHHRLQLNLGICEAISHEKDPARKAITREEYDIAINAMDNIRPTYKKILHSVCIKGNAIPEYAAMENVPISGVYNQFKRGLQKLRETQEVKNLIASHQC